jgi:hypothetical protein
MFPSADTSCCSPLPSSGFRGRPFREPCGSPPSPVVWARKTAPPSFPFASGFPWPTVPPMLRKRRGALLGSWEIPVEACPELGTPATLMRPCVVGRPDAAFRHTNGVGIATMYLFGAESSRPASSLCTLRCELQAVENDCLKEVNLIRPCVPSHVAYEVGRKGNNPSEALEQ